MKFKNLLEKTYFIKNYTNRKPKVELVVDAIELANLGPKAGNLQPLQFIIVEDPEGIATIAQACQQAFIAKAPYVIIISSNKTQYEKIYGDRSEKYLKQLVGSAAQIITLQLAESKISSSLIAPFSDPTLHAYFEIPDGNEIEILIAAGEAMGKAKTMRPPALINKLFFGKFGNKFHQPNAQVSRKDF